VMVRGEEIVGVLPVAARGKLRWIDLILRARALEEFDVREVRRISYRAGFLTENLKRIPSPHAHAAMMMQ